MKRKLIITVICLFSAIFIALLAYYCYIQYRQNKDIEIFANDIGWIDTKTFRINELLEMSDENLKKVKELDMVPNEDRPFDAKAYDYDTFPSIVSQLVNLEYLNFSYNKISDLTPIKHLTNLQKILSSGNKISDLKDFENFSNLIYLDIGHNALSDLKGVEKLKNMQYLNLFGNRQLSNLKGIESLANLNDLTIGYNNFESFPAEILYLKNLKKLSLEGLYFKSFPDSFYTTGLPIERLSMRDMHHFDYISNLSKFHELNNLRELYLSWDNIPKLNIDFAKCENLESFGYYYHKQIDIVDVLKSISKAPNLKFLGLSANNIRYLPENIVLPDSLEKLLLSDNKIKRLPIGIIKFKNLKWVDLKNNPIDTIAIKKIEKEMINTEFYYDK